MIVARCTRDGVRLRPVESKSVFCVHAMCSTCRRVYVLWGDRVTPCESPLRHVGAYPRFVDELPARQPIPRPATAPEGQTCRKQRSGKR